MKQVHIFVPIIRRTITICKCDLNLESPNIILEIFETLSTVANSKIEHSITKY
jgi:hypothetical protein